MNYEWTDQEKKVKEAVKAQFDKSDLMELQSLDRTTPSDLRNVMLRFAGKLAKAGYLELAMGDNPREEVMALVAAQEYLATLSGSLYLSMEASARLFGTLLTRGPQPEITKDILPALRRGSVIGAVAMAEPPGEDVAGPWQTVGVEKGENYEVTGNKSFATNAPFADYVAVVGQVEGKTAVFIVQPGMPGLKFGERLHTLGYQGLAVSPLELSKVLVPKTQVIGPFDSDESIQWLRMTEDLVITMSSVALMHRIMDALKVHAGSHRRENRPIIAFQEISFKMAEILTMEQTAQFLAYRAAWMIARNNPEARTLVHCAKVFAAESAEISATAAMQIMAGKGYIMGNPIEESYRDAKYAGISGTTTERCRMAIADDLIKRYQV